MVLDQEAAAWVITTLRGPWEEIEDTLRDSYQCQASFNRGGCPRTLVISQLFATVTLHRYYSPSKLERNRDCSPPVDGMVTEAWDRRNVSTDDIPWTSRHVILGNV